jgi:hypothetical protein
MNQWTPAEWDQYLLDRITRYEGDTYLVDSLVDTEEYTTQTAQREVQDPDTLIGYLEYDMLPHILADRAACTGLKGAILKPSDPGHKWRINADVIQTDDKEAPAKEAAKQLCASFSDVVELRPSRNPV